MFDCNFSLTENLIINPVLTLTAPERERVTRCKKVSNFIKAEVVARVVAIFTSFAATCDLLAQGAVFLYMSGHPLLKKCRIVGCATWSPEEYYARRRKLGVFTLTMLIGTVAGVIWPNLLRYFPQRPLLSGSFSGLIDQVPPEISKLRVDYNANHDIGALQRFWDRRKDLRARHWFVLLFNELNFKEGRTVRDSMSSRVYRQITAKKGAIWLNDKEMQERTGKDYAGYYFHATTLKALESILKSGFVQVRHEQAFRGAFVSTKPEYSFGNYILIFKRSIERLSTLNHGFTLDQDTYWAGFSKGIPVNAYTLACVWLNAVEETSKETLERQCKVWAGREIVVMESDEGTPAEWDMKRLLGIPKEWPEEGEETGKRIIAALRLANQSSNTQTLLARHAKEAAHSHSDSSAPAFYFNSHAIAHSNTSKRPMLLAN